MTYCLAMRLTEGLVFLSDTRTNAGLDDISTYRKLHVFQPAPDRLLVLQSAGNLATTHLGAEHPERRRPAAGRGAVGATGRRRMATMTDLDRLALAMPQATKHVEDDGRPTYCVHGTCFCFHRSARKDAVDPETGERLTDVLVFRVADAGEKEAILRDERGIFFTTPHWNGYSAVLLRVPDLARIDNGELRDLVAGAWLTRAQKRVAKAWLAEQGIAD